MFANFLIGLREGLEATLVVTILIAYLVKVDRRDRLGSIVLGVGAAVALSVLFGALLTFTSSTLSFEQQELFGGATSIVAVAFVTGMVFWMKRTARSLRSELDDKVGAALTVGAVAVGLTAFLAVGREGLETALFFFSAAQAAGSTVQPLIGFLLGIGFAVMLGWLLYRRAIKLNLARFFTWTGVGLIFVAAGVLAYGVHDLQEAGALPGLSSLAFDVSAQVPPDSWYGAVLKGIFNFSPRTTVLEAIVWIAYLVPVLILFLAADSIRGRLRRVAPQASSAAALLLLITGGCGGTAQGDDVRGVAVTAKDDVCETSRSELPAGTHEIRVANKGSKVTEVYVYAVGDRIMGEIENVTPGISRSFQVALTPGRYEIACKPGMVGDGVRRPLTVTGKAVAAADGRLLTDAVAGYRRYVVSQAGVLAQKTAKFADALRAGDLERAKALYADTRVHYERIEPIAESFADLDYAIDIRADGVESGKPWTGFHRIERALWKDGDVRQAARYADRLERDVARLVTTLKTTEITPAQLANGARQLLDEVATGKITGEEERYSHTDLADFQANLDGAKAAYAELRPVVAKRDPALAATVDRRFKALQQLLESHASGGEFVSYTSLTKQQIRRLADAVDAVSEPLSRVGGVALGG